MEKNSKIKNIKAREILDSRGNPTVEVELETDLGKFLASVPSGASKGKYEAVELRDGLDARPSREAGGPVLGKRYHGMGVLKAVKNVNEIIGPKLIGEDTANQTKIDEILINLDGTENKAKLGANAILPVSMAVCRAAAAAKNLSLYQHINEIYTGLTCVKLTPVRPVSLPIPCFNVINGGAHAGNDLDVQEFMIVPQKMSFSENLQVASEIYHQLKEILAKKYGKLATNLGDEGGFAPPIRFPQEAIELILEAAKKLNYEVKIILDVAASQFFKNGKYRMKIGVFSREGLLNYYSDLIQKYPIMGLEDPFSEDDWPAWQKLTSNFEDRASIHGSESKNIRSSLPFAATRVGEEEDEVLFDFQTSNLLIIGDDLTVTNPRRIKMAKEKEDCNAMILKINQIGTITEALEAAKLAKSFGWKIIVSHRSGETNDDFISDLAVGIGADFIKAGAPARGERVAKYNRLLKIEEELRWAS